MVGVDCRGQTPILARKLLELELLRACQQFQSESIAGGLGEDRQVILLYWCEVRCVW